MLILIIETSTEKGLIALCKNTKVINSAHLPSGPELSQNLALEVKKILDNQKPDLIAVGQGPGSFTGIRVAAALAQALSFGWNIPLVGFCSLKAYNCPNILIDAKMGGIYALVENSAKLIQPSDPILLGYSTASSAHPEQILKRIPHLSNVFQNYPNPSHMAELAIDAFEKKESIHMVYLNTL